MQKEIEKEYDEKTDITARKILDVHEQLINPHIDQEEREELEKEHGYHALIKFAELQHYFDSLLKPINGPPILEKKPYRDLMLSLNRKQHTVCINILAKLKRNELEKNTEEVSIDEMSFHDETSLSEEDEMFFEKFKNESNEKNQFEKKKDQCQINAEIDKTGQIVESIDKPGPFNLFVSGKQGTGKSMLLLAIYQCVTRFFNPDFDKKNSQPGFKPKSVVLVAAFTGQASFGVRGTTLDSLFSLNFMNKGALKPLGEKSLQRKRLQFKDIRLIIIDEISMVSYEKLKQIDQRMRQIKDKPLLPFGGVSVIVFGDFLQLKPVNSSPVYIRASNNPYEPLVPSVMWKNFRFIR